MFVEASGLMDGMVRWGKRFPGARCVPPLRKLVLSHILVSFEGRLGDAHPMRNPVWVSHGESDAFQLKAMKASNCFITIFWFGKVDEGTPLGKQEFDTINGASLIKQVGDHGLGYRVIHVSHPNWKQFRGRFFIVGLPPSLEILNWG